MVLSNKKLKQKLRASLAESLTASEEARNELANNDFTNPEPKSNPQQSLKSLLGSAIQKPRLSKREKRRKALPSQGPEDVKTTVDGASDKRSEEGGSEDAEKKKRKPKRKRDEGLESGGPDSTENVAEIKSKRKKKKKKKKSKSKNKKGKNAESEDTNEGEKSAKQGSEQGVTETNVTSHSQESEEVSTKVYVGGIPYYSTEDDIRSYFEGCGTITEVDCMKFPESGKFRGIAIINFKTEAAAKRALAFDGSDMGGLFLKIQPYKSTRAKKTSDFSPAIMEGYNRIYVGNLSWDITEDELRKLFSDCSIYAIRFGEDKETREFRGYAHVDFKDNLSLNMALKLDQKIVCGRPVRITCAVPKKVTGSIPKPVAVATIEKADENGGTSSVNGGTGSVSGKIRRRTCYECGEKGHLSSACPKKQATELTNSAAT